MTSWKRKSISGDHVSIHTSAREVTDVRHCYPSINTSFNPHFRKGSDRGQYNGIHHRCGFNPHFRKGSDILSSTLSMRLGGFNPHFRKGSDGESTSAWTSDVVSIHTSAREVTKHLIAVNNVTHVSIHTSAREVTCFPYPGYFRLAVSIHTSAREVTCAICRARCFQHVSIHTSAREVTYSLVLLSDSHNGFNPHFRKGSDCLGGLSLRDSFGFNPHFRKGSDVDAMQKTRQFRVSIHTSAREVTEYRSAVHRCWQVSIHTSAREVTVIKPTTDALTARFQSTLPQGK